MKFITTFFLSLICATSAMAQAFTTFPTVNPNTGTDQFYCVKTLGVDNKCVLSNMYNYIFTTLPAFVGDSGSGGTKGLVPAPSAGDALKGKVLGAGGGFVLPTTTTVTPQEYKLASDPDDTNSIKLALASCNTVEFSGNQTYIISAPLPICPTAHQKIFGNGPSSVIKLAASYNVTQATPCTAASDGANWRAIFYNVNCGGAVHVLTDTLIEYANFKIDASAASGAAGATIAIFNRNVQHLYIHGITCDSFADCTASLASEDVLITSSLALRNANAGFDFWDSPVNSNVVDTTVYCNSGYGLLYNASDTTSTHDGTAVNYSAIGNKQYGCSVGILIDPLTNGGLVQNFSIIGNLADALGQSVAGGINVGGSVQGGLIASPVFRDFGGASWGVLSIGPSLNVPGETGIPDGITTSNPLFVNVTVASGGVAPLRLLGNNNNRATGVTFTGSNSYPYAVDADTAGTLIEGKLIAGTSGLANVHGSFPQINNLNYTNATLGSCGSNPSIGGISAKTSVTVGSGAVTSCQVNFPSGAWAYAPTCTVSPVTAGDQLAISPPSASAAIVTSAVSMGGHSFYLICTQ